MANDDTSPLDQKRVTRIYDRNAPLYDAVEAPMEWLALLARRRELTAGLRGTVLELGVGTGRNLPFYPSGINLTAVDVSGRMLERARDRARDLDVDVTFVQADMRNLPFDDDTFDAVVTTFVFCSVADPRASMAEARRVVAPGGPLRMLEHQRPDSPFLAWLFDRLNPVAVRLSGANVNRETQRTVVHTGSSSVHARKLDRLGIVRRFDACDDPGDDVNARPN